MTPSLTHRARRAAVIAVALALPALALSAPAGADDTPSPRSTAGASSRVTVLGLPDSRTFRQRVPVNVVLVGYDAAGLRDDITSGLPASSKPIVRYPAYYGLQGRNLGLRFNYDYRVIDTPASFENRYFRYLTRIGTPSDPTLYQQQYNDQKKNVLDVKGPVLNIDAPSAERWLESRGAKQLGLAKRAYTVFLVNWWGRDDFAFHVYRKTDEPDPDTGVNFGADRSSRGMIAWGGTTGRSWFYDLSAGPEAWTGNWNVDNADVDGDGVPDYRMPAIWEYRKDGYRSRYRLGSDLGLIVRYVAVNLLFTSSPLYDPLVTAPGPRGGLTVPITMFEDNPTGSGTRWIRPANSVSKWRKLEPYVDIGAALKNVDPIDSGAKTTFRIFAGLNPGKGACWQQYGDTFAQPFCYFDENSGRYYRDVPRNYEAGVFAFFTEPANMGAQAGLLGYADDNWVDGTQSFVFAFDDPDTLSLGYGFTTTVTHEVGHHLGLSHPHDGYDPATGADYGAAGDSYFTWVGDESDTVMQYIAVSNGFGQFDRDNMARYQFAGYANWTSALISAAKASPDATPATFASARKARALLRDAVRQFGNWAYQRAAGSARGAYVIAQLAANRVGAGDVMQRSTLRVAATSDVPREGDPIRFPNT
jgi:hypothetical protein